MATGSEACKLHGLMMPMPDAGGRCRYCARDEGALDPTLPIPNDDSRCHCQLEPDGVPEGMTEVVGCLPGQARARVALHSDCPHHGGIARSIRRSMLGAVSIGSAR